jgi:hypothetical protein
MLQFELSLKFYFQNFNIQDTEAYHMASKEILLVCCM